MTSHVAIVAGPVPKEGEKSIGRDCTEAVASGRAPTERHDRLVRPKDQGRTSNARKLRPRCRLCSLHDGVIGEAVSRALATRPQVADTRGRGCDETRKGSARKRPMRPVGDARPVAASTKPNARFETSPLAILTTRPSGRSRAFPSGLDGAPRHPLTNIRQASFPPRPAADAGDRRSSHRPDGLERRLRGERSHRALDPSPQPAGAGGLPAPSGSREHRGLVRGPRSRGDRDVVLRGAKRLKSMGSDPVSTPGPRQHRRLPDDPLPHELLRRLDDDDLRAPCPAALDRRDPGRSIGAMPGRDGEPRSAFSSCG